MRHVLPTLATLLALSVSPAAFAAAAVDAAYDQNKAPIGDSNGKCVRTKWIDASDPCAIPEPPRAVVVAPKPAPVPLPVVEREQRTLYFDFNKATLTQESTDKLDQLAKTINESEAITNVTIHGFTDQIGTESYNKALANKRVDVAKAYLDGKSRLKAEGDIRGLGKAAPEEECKTLKKRTDKITCMARERRVEIEFNAQKPAKR